MRSPRVSDLDGLYVAANANVAVGSGPGIQTMRNKHGVVINLSSEQHGVKTDSGRLGCTHHVLKIGEVPVARSRLEPLVPA